jgi:hypothetical protein
MAYQPALYNLDSVVNSSSTPLGASAMFTGVGESVLLFSSIAIQVYSDQNGTLEIQWSIDNTNWDDTDYFAVVGGTSFYFQFSVQANYYRVIYINGATPQTVFRLGTILKAVQSPTIQLYGNVSGANASVFSGGELRTQSPSQLFSDTFDTTTLDTVIKWSPPTTTLGATVTIPQALAGYDSGGFVQLQTGATSGSLAVLMSQYAFKSTEPGWLFCDQRINLGGTIASSTVGYYYWGYFIPQSTPTFTTFGTTAILEGVGWEVVNGILYAVTYITASRTYIQDLSQATGSGRQPTDSHPHKYFIYFQGSVTYWAIDDIDNVVAQYLTGADGPNNNTMYFGHMLITGPDNTSITLDDNGCMVSDTSHTTISIGDGQNHFLKTSVTKIAPTVDDNSLVVALSPNSQLPGDDITGQLVISERQNDIQCAFLPALGGSLSTLLTTSNTGSGSATVGTAGYATFTSGATASSTSQSTTLQNLTIDPGHGLYGIFGIAFTPPTTTCTQLIGLWDLVNNGIYVGYNNGNIFQIYIMSDGIVVATIPQSSWDDPLTGGINSQFTRNGSPEAINFTYENTFRVRGAWAPMPIIFEVMSPDGNWVQFLKLEIANAYPIPLIQNPNLPFSISIGNGTDGGIISLTASVISAGSTRTAYNNTNYGIAPASPTVGVVSSQCLAANQFRQGAVFVNTSSNVISLAVAPYAAVLYGGITLAPYGTWVMDPFTFTQNAINAIASGAGSTLSIQEFQE